MSALQLVRARAEMVGLEGEAIICHKAEAVWFAMNAADAAAALEAARAEGVLQKRECLYATLGVHRAATERELRQAYKDMAWVLHPDRHAGAPEEEMVVIDRKFAALAAVPLDDALGQRHQAADGRRDVRIVHRAAHGHSGERHTTVACSAV